MVVGPWTYHHHHRSKKLGFEKGKLATNARPRGKAPRMVGIGMAVRNCLATAILAEWTYYWKTQRCKLVKWRHEFNPLGPSNWHHPKLGPMSKFNPFSTPMNPNESFGWCEIWHGYAFQCWRCWPLVRIGLGWRSMDHQIHHPSTSTVDSSVVHRFTAFFTAFLQNSLAVLTSTVRNCWKLLSPIILHSLQCFIVPIET